MLTTTDMMPLLLKACPSYHEQWEQYRRHSYDPGDDQLIYVDLGNFASYLVQCVAAGKTDECNDVFIAIERFHREGDDTVQEAATIGLLEGLQNHAIRHNLTEDQLTHWLGPESRRWWRGLQQFWSGQSPRVIPID